MDDLVLPGLRAALAGRYEVEHELGRGGMAVVYLARDLRHDRRVALKVLRRDISVSTATDRFLLEIRTAARLDHPHIVTVHDSGLAGDDLFYVMPYVEGESLRNRLERTGALPAEEALLIASEVADALEYAHGQGIVHRDIKPENILLSAGHARIADFGIARAIDVATGKLTDTGLAIGTPMYMSPEQSLADPKVDGRTDQYALGCVLYEMLAGTPPFTGPTAQAIMARHSADVIPPLTTVRAVSPALEAAVRRALAKAPSDRWPSAREFSDALRRSERAHQTGAQEPADGAPRRRLGVLLGMGALVIAVGLGAWLGRARRADAETETLRSVAVLPAAFTGDSSQALIADGLTEAVITGLVRVPGIRIPASNRVAQYHSTSVDPRQAGATLGVRAVVTTTVQIVSNRIRVTAQLVQVSDGTILWREQFDGDVRTGDALADVFPIFDELASRLVGRLAPHLTSETRQAVVRGPRSTDPEAYQFYLLARRASLSAGNLGNTASARVLTDSTIALLRQAIRRDSSFADAWAALADAFLWREVFVGLPPGGVVRDVRTAVDRALAFDSLNADAYARRGEIRRSNDWDWSGADSDFRRAYALAPSSAELLGWYSAHLAVAGELDSALAVSSRALSLDPTNSWLIASHGMNYAYAGQMDSAYVVSQRAVSLDSGQFLAYWVLVNSLLDRGHRAAADSAAEIWIRNANRSPDVLGYAAIYFRRSGNLEAARRVLSELTVRGSAEYIPPINLSVARVAVGDVAGALDALEQSERVRDRYLMTNLAHNLYSLRGEPRYERIIHAVYGDRPMNVPFR